MAHSLRFGLKVFQQDTTIDELRAVWRVADEAGFDHIWVYDHLAAVGPGKLDHPVFEGWALQAAMAEATKKVRIGCMVTGNTYRHPALLAKLAVTVDHLSAGRLEFGIGTAWSADEHRMYGIEGLDHRVGRLDESLQVMKSLWTEERSNFDGRYYRLEDATASPKPVQLPHPPIWVGAGGEQTMNLVARHADVWNISDDLREQWSELSSRLEEICLAVGRDYPSIRHSVQIKWDGVDRSALIEHGARGFEQGFTEQVIVLPSGSVVPAAIAAAEALSELRSLQV
jgi:F420-dependent oxidoreductase-like protein